MNWFKKHILSHIGANNTPNASTSDVEDDKHTDLLQSNNEETQNISENTICSDESTMSAETDSISHLKLNKQQLAAATYNGKHLLVLAGAGTGKTRTIIARAIHLISNGVNPNRIKILSFTKKSANEIATRIKIEGDSIPQAKYISGSTFHSWCMELITRFGCEFGLEGYSCIDEDDRESAISIAIGNLCNKKTIKYENLKLDKSVISDIYSYAVNTRQNLSSSIKAKLFQLSTGEDIDTKISNIKEIISPIIENYIKYKHTHKYIDYDDMLMAVAKILKQNDGLRKYISSLYDHILIDEMQDTNPLQWMLIESFMENCHLFCVGDDAQSIYGFRGADFKSIHSFVDRVPNSEVYKLEENYRSTQEILDLSNWLLDESPLKYDKHLFAYRGKGEKPVMQYVNDDWEEAELITDGIIKNVRIGKKKYKDHMVLTRSAYGARLIEAACISKKIPYLVFGGTTLIRSAHIRDVLSALRVLSNFRDELAWMRYLMLWEGVGEVTASAVIHKMLNCSSFTECINVVKLSKLKNKLAHKLLEDISTLQYHPDKAIDIAVDALAEILAHRYDNWGARKNDFSALKAVANQATDISSFITEYILDPIAELSKVLEKNDDNDKVVISTIHSAKGLEAEICYVINVTPGMFPSAKAETDEEIEEERRCLYVAMTRAKNVLHLFCRHKSSSAFRESKDTGRKIKSIKDEKIKGYICGKKSELDKNDEEIVYISFKIGDKPVLKMEETKFWEKFKIDNSDNKDDAFFFNGLPDSLAEKIAFRPHTRQEAPKSVRNKEFKIQDTLSKEFWDIDFS